MSHRLNAAVKLAPDRITLSPFFRAALSRMLNITGWTEPEIEELVCVDGILYILKAGRRNYEPACDRTEMVQCVLDVAHLARLTIKERAYVLSQIPS